ncbi:amino acid ABC transporter ATP-binding protein [bacterium]|nr:MAG: amino acid ABC transporter ATP-binding protein [bacterium]
MMDERNGAPIIEARGLRKSFGPHEVLKGVDLSIARGEVLAIIGPSGSGKSTLLRCLNLLERPTAGEVWFEGARINDPGVDVNRVRTRMGMVFQLFNLFPHLTVIDNVTLAQEKVLHISRQEAEARAQALLAKVGLAAKEHAYPNSLSGGQKQRVAIARALALRPAVMLFDEPTSALDPEMVQEVLATMDELVQEGMTMAVVTHEMGFARRAAGRIVFVDEGRIVADAPPERFFSAPESERVRQFLEKIPT